MNLIKEEVLKKLSEKGYNPPDENGAMRSFDKRAEGSDGTGYRACFEEEHRYYVISQRTPTRECLWRSVERREGDHWITEDDYLEETKCSLAYTEMDGKRFGPISSYCTRWHNGEVDMQGGFADLWNLKVAGGDEAIQKYREKQQALREKIEEKKKHIEKRNADPEWQEIKEEVKQLRTTQEGRAIARKLIQAYLQREKQNFKQ